MCVFCKQSEKYFYNLWHGEGEAHMCLHLEQEKAGAGVGKDVRKGESNDRGKEKLPRQMESFWPNEMRTTSVGRLVGVGTGAWARVGVWVMVTTTSMIVG